MSSYRWEPWEQPILSGNNDYGAVSASSVNATSPTAQPWKALDGIREGSSTSWESARDAFPAWWKWQLPVTLRITHLKLYNKYSSYSHVTKDAAVYIGTEMTQLVTEGTFPEGAFSVLEFDFDEPVITNILWVLCENGYMPSNTFVGLGEVEITAEQGIQQFDVCYMDWDGTVLKEETVDFGGSVTPPEDPVRQGYTFTGWSATTAHVVADMAVVAQYTINPREDEYLLTTLTELLGSLNIPVETGVFKGTAPDSYAVLTPIADTFELYADDRPSHDVQEIRISLFDKGNYLQTKSTLVRTLLDADITITDRRYIDHEDDTGYHHYAIDVAKLYELEE